MKNYEQLWKELQNNLITTQQGLEQKGKYCQVGALDFVLDLMIQLEEGESGE